MGKKEIGRETDWEREKDITRGDRKKTGVREDRKIERQGGKEKDRKRDGLEEREKNITRGDRNEPVTM